MFTFRRVALFSAFILTACSSEIPKPTINTSQPSYEFTGTGFLLSGYIGADCDCSFAVNIDGEAVELADDGMFQKFIEPHYTSSDGKVQIDATAKSNGFRSLESQSEKTITFKRTPTAFRVIAPESNSQDEVTVFFSGTPLAEVSDGSWKKVTTLDENGSGSVTLSFNPDYKNKGETMKFHARTEGYNTATESVNIENALYDAERIADEEKAAEEEKRKEQEEKERQRELAEMRRIRDALRPKFNKLNEYYSDWLALYQQYGIPDKYGFDANTNISMTYGDVINNMKTIHDPLQEKLYDMYGDANIDEDDFELKLTDALWNYSFALVTTTPWSYAENKSDIQKKRRAVEALLY